MSVKLEISGDPVEVKKLIRLYAAAPDLLDALYKTVLELSMFEYSENVGKKSAKLIVKALREARAAIAMAEGRDE